MAYRSVAFPCCLLLLLLLAGPAPAQGTKADYARADRLGREARDAVRDVRVEPHWLEGDRFWYEGRAADGSPVPLLVDCRTGEKRPLFDREAAQAALAAALVTATGGKVESGALRIAGTRVTKEGKVWLLAVHGGRPWVARLEAQDRAVLVDPGGDHPFTLAPGPGKGGHGRRRPYRNRRVTVIFYNRAKEPVSLYWLDPAGQRKPYGTIPPGGMMEQSTFPGHRWLVLGPKDEAWGRFTAGAAAGLACITGPGKDATPERRREKRRPGEEGTEARARFRVLRRGFDLYLEDREAKEAFRLTSDGKEGSAYLDRCIWSPGGRYAIAFQREEGQHRMVTEVESSPRDQVQPKVHTFRYDKPGDRIDIDWPVVVDPRARRVVPVPRDLFPNPFGLGRYTWDPGGDRFYFLYNQRGHQVLRVIEVEAATAKPRILIEETSRTFIDYSSKTFLRFLWDTDEILWMSERDGWNHLYLYDRKAGKVKGRVTRGAWVVRSVEHVDEEARVLWFRACGVLPGQDPCNVHYARVNLDGTGFTLLTEGDGTHEAVFSPDRRFLVDRWSRPDRPPVTELKDGKTGRKIRVLERADVTAWRKLGIPFPEPFTAKGRDGATDIYGLIYRPSTLDPSRTYPVIENIYAGPHGQFVPKGFRPWDGCQAMAEIGFIVVRIDGMGTNWRSRAFHDVAWKNLRDAGFPDRIRWIKAAARKYPYIDLERVGIYGGSAGGQNALRGLLDHPEFYKAGAADCGCHDNRMDKIWWNEQWMGWPVDESYVRSSNVADAHKLQGKLLLTVGELDRNVDPSSTLQVVDALIRADKDFELIVFPGRGHGAGGSPYGVRRLRDFFVRNLWGVEPRRE